MAMQMHRAFSALMLSPLYRYTVAAGSFDADNNWVDGSTVATTIYGVVKAGNKFSQFEEGIAIQSEDGGVRHSDYRSLYCKDTFPVELGDKIEFKGAYYNVLQKSDEDVYGFNSFILEKSENWTP